MFTDSRYTPHNYTNNILNPATPRNSVSYGHSWPPWHGGKQDIPSPNPRQLRGPAALWSAINSAGTKGARVTRGPFASTRRRAWQGSKASSHNKLKWFPLIGPRFQKQTNSHCVSRIPHTACFIFSLAFFYVMFASTMNFLAGIPQFTTCLLWLTFCG